MKFDLSRLDELVDLMEAGNLSELELEDDNSSFVIERKQLPKKRKSAEKIDDTKAAVTSGRVGIFSRQISVGDEVSQGQQLGDVRMMNVLYPVLSPADGVVEEIFVEDGVGVEYAQPLMIINMEN
ncbi:MAG: hypothetical protein JKX97_07700 [Candidatus Lindowbacteria bacterium]|nr:hypothetical protein [Candidatus Lindowbacteria bacterium]